MQSDIQLKINFIKSTTLVSGKHGFKSHQSFSFFNSFFNLFCEDKLLTCIASAGQNIIYFI